LALANQTLTDRTSRLEREVMLDPLTGVPNRRTLDAQLASAHRDAVARGDPLFVAMLDVDRFKQVNDTYSHAVGDVVLRRLATLVQEHARAVDLLARYGGEEFVVVLAVSALAAAVAACERIRARIQSEDFSPIAPGLTVTASLGVADIAAFPGPEAGLRRVDELLYAAKAAGRNRVMS
jgi:diguanylate cyclase (GGDEF)-like protein